MSNRCIHTDVSKLAIFVLMLLISIVMATNAHAMAAKVDLAEPVVTTDRSNFEVQGEKLSNTSDTKGISQKKLGDKPILGKKSLGNPNIKNTKELQTRDDTSTSDRLRQMMAMVVVILVLGGVSWVVCKKFLPRLKGSTGIKGRAIKVIETTYISPRQPVHLLQVGTKKLLIAGGKEGLRMLTDVTDDFSNILDEKHIEGTEENL